MCWFKHDVRQTCFSNAFVSMLEGRILIFREIFVKRVMDQTDGWLSSSTITKPKQQCRTVCRLGKLSRSRSRSPTFVARACSSMSTDRGRSAKCTHTRICMAWSAKSLDWFLILSIVPSNASLSLVDREFKAERRLEIVVAPRTICTCSAGSRNLDFHIKTCKSGKEKSAETYIPFERLIILSIISFSRFWFMISGL